MKLIDFYRKRYNITQCKIIKCDMCYEILNEKDMMQGYIKKSTAFETCQYHINGQENTLTIMEMYNEKKKNLKQLSVPNKTSRKLSKSDN